MTQPAQDIEQRNVLEEKECIYEKFHIFDFCDNVKFQAGWSKIVTAVPEERQDAECLKAKLFFYSKLYGKVTKEGYEQWLKDHSNSIQEGEVSKTETGKSSLESESNSKTDDLVKIEIKSRTTDTQVEVLESNDLDPVEKKDGGQSENHLTSELNKGDNLDTAQSSALEFSRIAEMIEKGLTLPGIEELNIKPLEIDPNPSEMERLKKPWEN
ncbi:uncharacterized protein LOC117325435 [Pecten maximus]|uniref:uncharacterized protein LOC117325435 n=1 Tax=Pecten maximus TaxID=6579 RepID=UPI0014583DD5|nr:uncharacterized protein LOC117325435 [Pecten maximus]XP_033737528.1 uncharacterized protein LOC117325435 [Pecten maximus]XP_033737530.1 uncharacterized protein LOC117325435 [Pecten maximus]